MLQRETDDGVVLDHVDPERQDAGYNPLKEKYNQLLKDYNVFSLPKKIIDTAADIYIMVMKSVVMKRGRRRAMMCKCVYEAYKKHGVLKDPILLARDFKITVKQLRKAQDHFHEEVFNSGFQDEFPKRHLTAKNLLPDMIERMGIEDAPISELSALVDLIYSNDTLVERMSPRDIAISVLHWYINRDQMAKTYDSTQEEMLITKAKLTKTVTIIKNIMSRV